MLVRRPARKGLPGLRSLRGGGRTATIAVLLLAWGVLAFFVGAAAQQTGFFGVVVRPTLEAGIAAPGNWLRARLANPTRIDLDVKFEDYRQLGFARERAIEQEAMFAGENDYVPARIRSGDEDVKIRIRLKGDSIAHLMGDKWSFRVDVRGEGTLFGMKRFSLHHPGTRNYLGEWIYHRALRREGVIGLRYEFVELHLNGKNLGIYALEEHFDKRLVEHNRRREGPILRFDEDLMWREAHHQIRPFRARAETTGYGDYEVAPVDGFRTSRTLADPAARKNYLAAVQLLEAFRAGELTTPEVFDEDLLATYFALVDLLGAEHGARWHNLRLYFNPVTSRLEPIGFDGLCTAITSLSAVDQTRIDRHGHVTTGDRPLQRAIFSDLGFYARYLAELERISDPAYLDALLADLQPDLDEALAILHREFPQVRVPEALFRSNQQYLRSVLDPVATIRAARSPESASAEVGNLQRLPAEILGVEIPGEAAERIDLDEPLVLLPRAPGEPVSWQSLPVAVAPEGPLNVVFRILGTTRTRRTGLTPYVERHPGSSAESPTRAAENATAFEFVTVSDDGSVLAIRPGHWRIESDFVVGPGRVVRVGPGTRLDLGSGAAILSHSPFEWRGTADAPIVVESSDATGRGVTVLGAQALSRLEHVRFRGLRPPEFPGWTLTGAVTFYESPLELEHVEFLSNVAEDSLNVIRGDFALREVTFRNTTSDALDVDFGRGHIESSRFFDSGNDAIDVSGSDVEVRDVLVERAGDKGVSTGEASDLVASHLRIHGANVALASKDQSTLIVRDVELRDCRWAVAAFQKKSEFGPARIEVEGMKAPPGFETLVERGSDARIDGVPVPPADDRDIKAILYGDGDDQLAAR